MIMKMEKLKLVIIAGALGVTFQAHATLFDLSYSDLHGNTLSGDITASFVAGSGNEYAASSAALTLSSRAYPQFDGSYSLASSSGAFDINNILYYPGDPIVDFWGVLTLQSSAGTYVNLFSAAPDGSDTARAGYYALVGYNGGYINFYPSDGSSNIGGPATATLFDPVPEPTTLIAGGLMLLPFGASTLRILRRNRAAQRD